VNLSGVTQVDPIIQADLLYAQVQQTAGLNVIPVNRVVEVFAALKIEQVQSEEQAAIICDVLGCDALLIATITAYDPYGRREWARPCNCSENQIPEEPPA